MRAHAATLLLLQHLHHAHTYLQLAGQVAAGCLVYGVGLIWLFFTGSCGGIEVRTKFREYVSQAVVPIRVRVRHRCPVTPETRLSRQLPQSLNLSRGHNGSSEAPRV